jgi:hypothetical protein
MRPAAPAQRSHFSPSPARAGKTQVGFDAFAASAWEAWLRARAAAGAPAEEVESAARDYYKALSKGGRLFGGGHKGKTPEGTAEEFVARARATAAAAAAGAGSWFDGVTEAVACRWDATKCRVREMMHAGGAAVSRARAAALFYFPLRRAARCAGPSAAAAALP